MGRLPQWNKAVHACRRSGNVDDAATALETKTATPHCGAGPAKP
jgi:hypothetical protein